MKARDEKDIVEMFESEFTRSEDKYSLVKTNWKEDNEYSLNAPWDANALAERTVPGEERPCLRINKIDPLCHKIVNEAKQQKLEGKVKPVGDGSDPETALVLEGILRHIQYTSNAARAYMWAYECAVRAGVGYYRINTEYANERSFDQVIRYERIRNPLCVSFDPDSEDPAGRDAKRAIISEGVSKKYAEVLCKSVGYDFSKIVPDNRIWTVSEGTVRHGEIYWEELEPDELFLFRDGSTGLKKEMDPIKLEYLMATDKVAKSRKVQVGTIMYANLCDGKVLEKLETNSKYIPIVRMIGREGYINGKVDYRGITRNSKDSNRMYNVMASLLVERIGLAPRAPYIGAAGQFDGFEDMWQKANKKNYAKLEYNPVTIGGVLAPAPQKNDAPAGDATIERYMMIADGDIKDTSAMSDAFMGNRSNETSSVAIKARAAQSSGSTYDFFDNACASIEHGMNIALNMIPQLYSDRQEIAIMGEDNKEKVINLQAYKTKTGEVRSIDLSAGENKVEVSVATGDKTRRETAIEQLSFVLQTNPEAGNLIMDIFVGNLDIKDADKIAKRFKALLPPAVVAAEEQDEKDNPELDALQQHAEQVVAQLKAQLDECIAKLQDAEMQLKNKEGELKIKQQEVDIKRQEVDIKAAEAANKIKVDSKEAGISPEGGEDLVGTITALRSDMEHIHAEMDMVTTVLEQIKAAKAPQEIEQGEITQPPVSQDLGSGPPPAEAENNVGAI